MMNKNRDGARQILATIDARTGADAVDVDVLFAQYQEVWSELYLDELAMVVADEKLAAIDIFDERYYRVLDEYTHMISPAQVAQLLRHAWVPKLRRVLSASWEARQQDIFALIQTTPQLQPILGDVSSAVMPYALRTNDVRWAVLLECTFDQTVELCCDRVAQCAPGIPAELRYVRHPLKVLKLCLGVWAATASAEELGAIRRSEWAEWGLCEDDTSAVLAAALRSVWPLDELVARYVAVQRLGVEPCSELRRAMVYTLNCINAAMDRSGDVPRSLARRAISLAELLEQWCGSRGIECHRINGAAYRVGSKRVDLRDGVFWVGEKACFVEELG